MSKTDFIPTRDGDLDGYELNFLNKLTAHAATLSLDPADVSRITAVISNHRLSYANVLSKRAESRSANEDNVLKKRNAINELRRGARVVKSNANYTKAVGDDLQIIGPDKAPRILTELKPELRTRVHGQEVLIKFKKDDTDGIRIYTRRGSESEFSFLVHTSQSQYVDQRPKLESNKPEQREYYAVFFEETHEVGKRSDVRKITIE